MNTTAATTTVIDTQKPLRIFVIAGEASGDILGAGMMHAIREIHPNVQFEGIGGAQMERAGLASLFPMQELSVMGVAEVLPRIFKIISRMNMTAREIVRRKPDVVVTIDSPDFCFRVIKKVKAKDKSIRCVHYVAPSVWAWRPKRAYQVSRFLDHVLCLLPFEPPFFEKHGLEATFVGHPVVERLEKRGDGARFRAKHGLSPSQPVLAMLPGSRMSEISKLLETFSETADKVLRRRHNAVIVIPTLPHLKPALDKFFAGLGINPLVIIDEDEKHDSFAAATVAIAASGTVTLELAMADTPHIIAYRVNGLTAYLARKMIRTPYVNLINILLRRPTVPELLQADCTPAVIAREVSRLIEDRDARAAQMSDFRTALIKLGLGDPETPSQKAAQAVLQVATR